MRVMVTGKLLAALRKVDPKAGTAYFPAALATMQTPQV